MKIMHENKRRIKDTKKDEKWKKNMKKKGRKKEEKRKEKRKKKIVMTVTRRTDPVTETT